MQTTISTPKKKISLNLMLGLASALLAIAALANLYPTFGISDRTALIGLTVVGMALCAFGMQLGTFGWLNPFNLLGIVLGSAILLLVIAVLVGIQVPFIPNDRAAITLLAGVMGLKAVVGVVRSILAK